MLAEQAPSNGETQIGGMFVGARQKSGEGVVGETVVQKGVFGESVSSLPP